MEGQTGRSLNSFTLFFSELLIKLELSNIIGVTSCVVHVLCGFSIECLKTPREFSETSRKHLAALLYLLNDRPLSMFHYI